MRNHCAILSIVITPFALNRAVIFTLTAPLSKRRSKSCSVLAQHSPSVSAPPSFGTLHPSNERDAFHAFAPKGAAAR